jgi:hypothetical protein
MNSDNSNRIKNACLAEGASHTLKGADGNTYTDMKENVPMDVLKNVVRNLANQAAEASGKYTLAQGDKLMTEADLVGDAYGEILNKFDKLVDVMNDRTNKQLTEVRQYRQALTMELNKISDAFKEIKNLDLGRMVSDLATLDKIMQSPGIKDFLSRKVVQGE